MTLAQPAVSISLKNILLATDLSECSEKALQYAQGLAQHLGSRVQAVYVSGPESYHLLDPEALSITFHEVRDASRHPTDVLKSLFQGLPTQISLRQGDIWEVINDVITRNQIDLLVLGTHGRTGIPKLLQGSVAEQLFRNVSRPVLTIGPDARPFDAELNSIQRVLLATDLERQSSAPFYAGWLSKEFQAKLTVMHVEGNSAMDAHQRLLQQLGAAISRELDLPSEPECRIACGPPAAGILAVAREWQADLIVLGARHPREARVTSHSPWAIASRVIAEAGCPVLTVREPD